MKTLRIVAVLGMILAPAALLANSDLLLRRQPDMTVFNPYEMAVQRHGIPVVR
jgi:hypothetical protein